MPATSLARVDKLEAADGALTGVLRAPPISPELVLVSPDLRELALAALSDRDPDGWIPRRLEPPPPPLRLVPRVEPAPPVEEPEPPALHGRALVVPAAAYVLDSVAHAARMGFVIIASITVLAAAADVLHP